MAGLTPEGLTVLRLPEVVEELRDKAREIWADTVPEGEVVNVEDNSAIGRQIGVVAPSSADLWEAVQEVYDAFNPNTAADISLDNLVALGGVTRIPPSPTRVTCLVTGNTNTVIPQNSKVSSPTTNKSYSSSVEISFTPENASAVGVNVTTVTNNTTYTLYYRPAASIADTAISVTTPTTGTTLGSLQTQFINLVSSSFPEFQTEIVDNLLYFRSVDPFQLFTFSSSVNLGVIKVVKPLVFTADEVGPVEQATGTVSTIITPVLGWDSVNNPTPAATGSLRETDEELRERFRNSKFNRATNVVESLYSAILEVQGVKELRIYENDTPITDSNGVLGHGFLTIVDGGLGTAIAQAIWENKPIGILSQGNTTVTVIDSSGFPHDVSFSRPIDVPIYIDISLNKYASFPPNGEELIRSALVEYVNNLEIGDDVVYSRLYTPINTVAGHQIESLRIGTTPAPASLNNIIVDFDSVANTDTLSITFS